MIFLPGGCTGDVYVDAVIHTYMSLTFGQYYVLKEENPLKITKRSYHEKPALTTQCHGRHCGTPASKSPEALLKNACSWPYRPTESEVSGVESQTGKHLRGVWFSLKFTTCEISNDSTLWMIYYIFLTSVKKASEDHHMKLYVPNIN